MRLFVIVRHGESTLNLEGRVNGDPTIPVPLSDAGREAARELGLQVARIPLEHCYATRFQRTQETAAIALEGRDVPVTVEPLLDDIDIGMLEGGTLEDYRAWKRVHTRRDPFPGGESLDEAAERYSEGYRRVLGSPHRVVLVVTHEIPLRYALNAAGGSEELDGPVHQLRNAVPYCFDERSLERAVERMRLLATVYPEVPAR
jgi:broad specificity phosphatase PhoE